MTVLLAYAQVSGFDFVRYDDQMYTYENPNVTAGLTAESVKWAFTAVTNVDYWRPLSLLSHVVDAQLFGMRSGMHHLVNVFFHAFAAIVLFVSFKRATKAPGLSAFVAFIFALHPLHVESVAWVTERKDVLSTLFCFLSLYAYVRYAEQRRVVWYVAAAALFCLGLMSKPMVVTFPFVLLLMDFWPLRRLEWPRSVIEKIPLLVLSAGVSAITYLGQQASDQIEATPAALRLKNAFVWYLGYIGQTFWPTNLAVYYPFPSSIPAWEAAAAFVVFIAITIAAVSMWRTRPYVAVGWFWYVGTLVPVIGFVRSGYQAHADRYMYLPMVGLTIILAWGAADIAAKWPGAKNVLVAAAVAACFACLLDARAEVANWRDTSTLFEHAAAAGHDSALGENNLGYYILFMGRSAEAIPHFESAILMEPSHVDANYNLGLSLMNTGKCAAAIPRFENAIRVAAGRAFAETVAKAHNNIGVCMLQSGNTTAAIPHFEAAVHSDPTSAEAQYNLGVSLMSTGNSAAAIPPLEAAQRLKPSPQTLKILNSLRAPAK